MDKEREERVPRSLGSGIEGKKRETGRPGEAQGYGQDGVRVRLGNPKLQTALSCPLTGYRYAGTGTGGAVNPGGLMETAKCGMPVKTEG